MEFFAKHQFAKELLIVSNNIILFLFIFLVKFLNR